MVRDNELQSDLAEALGKAAEPLSDRARAQIRARVMDEVRADGRSGLLMLASHRFAAAATALAMVGGGVAYAAERALPGDPLYGVKIAAENTAVTVLPSGGLEDRLLVAIAARRARETAALACEGMPSDAIDESLDALRDAVRHATPAQGELSEDEVLRIREEGLCAPAETRDAIDEAISTPTRHDTPGDTGSGGTGSGGTMDGGTGGGEPLPDGGGTGGSTPGGGTDGMKQPGTGDSSDMGGTGDHSDAGDTGGAGSGPTSETAMNDRPITRRESCDTSQSIQPR